MGFRDDMWIELKHIKPVSVSDSGIPGEDVLLGSMVFQNGVEGLVIKSKQTNTECSRPSTTLSLRSGFGFWWK